MAKQSFPMITEGRWWTLRTRFLKSLPNIVTPSYLSTVLGISEKTAKSNEIPLLKRLGLIDSQNIPTELANQWRSKEDYAVSCKTIREQVYPEELLHVATDPDRDGEAALRWFRSRGLGEKTSRDLARSYFLLLKADTNVAEKVLERKLVPSANKADKKKAVTRKVAAKTERPQADSQSQPGRELSDGFLLPNIHIDLQLHISPDASASQIEDIFASMAKHLYGRHIEQ